MAGESCSLTCNVKDPRTGDVKVSALWDDLTKFFKGDRRQAVTHYFLTKDSNFLRENSDVLEFDVDGEVTIASLKKALERDGEYSNLSNARTLEHLNKEIKAGRYDYSEALDNVLKFNKSNQFREGFMATLKKEPDGMYSVKVVERNPQSEYELADHVQNKLLTDALRIVLEQKGLSVEFLDNPSYAGRYSTLDATMGVDGLYSVASLLNGINTSNETAEVAGHFVVAAMQDNPLVQRLVEQLTPKVQQALFTDEKAPFKRDDFVVSEDSAMEAAGILVGKQLLEPFVKAQKGSWYSAANIGNAIPKAVKFILKKIGNFAKRIFGMYKPDEIQKQVQRAKEQASTVAQGFISDPSLADTQTAFDNPTTFTGGKLTKRLSDDARRSVKAYLDTVSSLKDIMSRLKTSIGRAESPTNRQIFDKLKALTKGITSNYTSQLSAETLAKTASIEGMVVALEGITQILDTDIRTLLDEIQPSDRTQSYTSITTNARNMRTVNTAIKNIGELYLAISNKLDTLGANEKAMFQDADGNLVSESLREAVNRLGDVLLGKEEAYEDVEGDVQNINGLQKLMELKRRQIFLDAIQDFWGKDYVELNAGKVWQQKGLKFKLVKSGNRRVEVKDWIDSLEEDISWFDRYLSSCADCGDFVTAIGAKVTKNANMNADRLASTFWDRIEALRIQMQDVFGTTDCRMLYEVITDADGHRTMTGNLVSQVNYGAWEAARKEFKQELKKGFNEYMAAMKKQAYENNKGTKGYTFSPTDEQRAVFYHAFAEPLWEQWHNEHSEKDKVTGRMMPDPVKYHNSQWDELFDISNPSLSAEEKAEKANRLRWYNTLMELKDDMDGLLPKSATVRWRAPQMTGRFSHRFRNLRGQMGNSLQAFGHAMRKKAQDFAVVRADEAWMFGSNNEFNEIEEDPLENPMFFEKEKINRLPLFGINKLKDMNDLSTDLFGTMLQYGSMAATYNAMERVVDVFELGRDVLKQRKVGNKIEANREEESRAYSRYAKFLEKQIYGINVDPPKWDRKGMIRKLANNLSSIGGRILLWGNVHGGIVNTGTGMYEIFKEAVSGENFSMHDVTEAHKMYFDGIMKTMGLGLANIQRPDDKNSLWIRHWNIQSENRDFLHNQKFDTKAMSLLDNRLWEWFGHTMMLPYSSGDHYMQTIPYYAMGNKMRVYDHEGNSMRLIDAYEIVDGEEVTAVDDPSRVIGRTPKKLKLKEGIFRSAADIDKYDTVQGMQEKIANFFDSHPGIRGSVVIDMSMFSDSEIEYLKDEGLAIPTNVKQLETLKNALWLKSNELTFNEDDESAFMDKCRNICNRLHGIYNTEDKVAFQQNFYGSLVTAMRGYALGMINRRYADSRFNVAQDKVVEGSSNTAFKVLMSALFDINNMDNWKAVGEALLLTAPISNALLFNKGYGHRLKADMIKAGFSEHQYYNMRRFGADFLIIEAIALMKLLSSPGRHFGLGDEDEDKKTGIDQDNLLAGLTYYFMMRWDREQEAFNTPRGMWNEATSLMDYIPVGFSGAKAIWDIASLAVQTQVDKALDRPDRLENSELYYQGTKQGVYEEGEEKWKARFMRLCPYIRSWYTFTHPYDAASGFEYGRRVRGK